MRFIFTLILLALLSGCASSPSPAQLTHQFKQIHVGMSRDEVYQLLGKPQGIDVKRVKDVTIEMWVTPRDSHGHKVQLSIFFWADGRAHKVEHYLTPDFGDGIIINPWPNKSPEPTTTAP